MDKLPSVDEAAAALGLSVATVRKYTYLRKLPFVKLGGRLLFRPDHLQQLIERNTRLPMAWTEARSVSTPDRVTGYGGRTCDPSWSTNSTKEIRNELGGR